MTAALTSEQHRPGLLDPAAAPGSPAISRLLKPDAWPLPRLLRNELHAGSLQGFLSFP